tara:strand:- start:3484 stop:3939 length:456 start_codon:yes stop_codon:yes gene_type:complete
MEKGKSVRISVHAGAPPIQPPRPKSRIESLVKRETVFAGGHPAPGDEPIPYNELNTISLREIAEHNVQTDAWVAVNGKVLDITNWFELHPGGIPPLLMLMGTDATKRFNEIHPPYVIEHWAPWAIIGEYDPNGPKPEPKVRALFTIAFFFF